jgi:hypothetical protein
VVRIRLAEYKDSTRLRKTATPHLSPLCSVLVGDIPDMEIVGMSKSQRIVKLGVKNLDNALASYPQSLTCIVLVKGSKLSGLQNNFRVFDM